MPTRSVRHPFAQRLSEYPIALATIVAVLAAANLGGASQDKEKPFPAAAPGRPPCGSCAAPVDLAWKTIITRPEEPGEAMEISGVIFLADGKTPAVGYVLFVYQTDATGYYNKQDDASQPRLHGWMKTGADGRYAFRTIKPGGYPHRNEPAHIHARVYGPNYPERTIDEYWFAGDPRITPEALAKVKKEGDSVAIVTLERDEKGILRGTRDITLKMK